MRTSPSPPDAFQRVFPASDLWRGDSRSSILWSIAGSLVLALILFHLYLIVDLLATGDNLLIPESSEMEMRILAAVVPDSTVKMGTSGATYAVYSDHGLLPAVWHSRHQPWGLYVRHLYLQFPVLRESALALQALCLSSILLLMLRWGLHSQARILRRRGALEVSNRLRSAIHRQTMRLGPSTWKSEEENKVLRLFTSDVDTLREAIFQRLDTFGSAPVKLTILVMLLLAMHPVLTFQCLIPLGACWYLYVRERRRSDQSQRLSRDRAGRELNLLSESLRKTRLVAGFHVESFASERFGKSLIRYDAQVSEVLKNQGFPGWKSRLFLILCGGLVVYLVSMKVLMTPDQLSFGTAITFLTSLCWMYFPLESLWLARIAKRDGLEVASRIQRYLDQVPSVGQMVGAKFLPPLSRMLEFESVSYFHPSTRKQLLSELTMKIPAGRSVAVISTDPQEAWAVGSLLPRFLDPQSGQVRIDGEDISAVTLDSLRAEVACVWGQESFFSGTVRENLSMGNESLNLAQIVEGAKTCHAHSFISQLPLGYETMIGEHGEDLDDGQAFLLSLARAYLRNPALMLIEEPNKKLDEDTKDLMDDAYQRIIGGRTIVFFPSRLSTLKRVDEIILMHQGKVVAIGPHSQLVKKDPLYRHWEYLKFNEFRHQMELQGSERV